MFGTSKRRNSSPRIVTADDLITDRRLKDVDEDRLDHEALAQGVAEIALSAEAPVNIALFGPWGSGKSSVYSMIEQHLKKINDKRTRVVRYDAWKYGGQDLKRNFITSVAHDLHLDDDQFQTELHQDTEVNKIDLYLWVKQNWRSLLLGIFAAIFLTTIWITGFAATSWAFSDNQFPDAVRDSVPSAGTVFGLALVALLVGPKVLEGAVVKVATNPPSGDDQFAERFRQLTEKVGKSGANRLVVFIDELDRCAPQDVVATLIDLKTFLDQENCVFVVAADREVIERSLNEVPQAKPVREDEPYYATPGAFLDKIFQHQIALPPLRPRALTRFARSLVEDQAGVWGEMRRRDTDLFETVVFALVPVHVRSPRRVKVLLNNFATNARIAHARGIPWLDRALEIAVMTVLQTEFPSVANDLLRVPRLLTFMRGEEKASASDILAMLRRYDAPFTADEPSTMASHSTDSDEEHHVDELHSQTKTAAGTLLMDVTSNHRSAVEARRTLNRHLAMYLSKIHAGDIPDPRPDLFYLQTAGHVDGLPDPRLGDVIDFAGDTPPDDVVAAFTDQPSRVRGVAVRLLVAEGESTPGPGRILVFEAACRLVEGMDIDDVREIARGVAPAILAARFSSRWPQEAIPGAITLAVATGATAPAKELLARIKDSEQSSGLLTRVANILPYAEKDQADAIYAMLDQSYISDPEPLHEALAALPLSAAEAIWRALSTSVSQVLAAMEAPAPSEEPAGPRPVAPGRTAATPAGPAESPGSTDDGRVRLRQLLKAVESRTDGEKLLSAVFSAAQSSESAEIRSEALALASGILEHISDPRLINRHALHGIQCSVSAYWANWGGFLIARTEATESMFTDNDPEEELSATDVLVDNLIPRIAAESDARVLDSLPDIVESVASLVPTENDEHIREAVHSLFQRIKWADNADETDSPAGLVTIGDVDDLRVKRRSIAHRVARSLDDFLDTAATRNLLAADIYRGVETVALDEDTQVEMLTLISALDSESSRILSHQLDGYKPRDDEHLAVLCLRVRTRRRFNGPALRAEGLSLLDNSSVSSSIVEDWMSLNPDTPDVASLASRISIRSSLLDVYAAQRTSQERALLWVTLERASAVDGTLLSVGLHGVDETAIEHMSAQVSKATRQHERNRIVDRLVETSRITGNGANNGVAARRSANEMAKNLLERRIVGDARLAVRLVIWAGGPSHGYQGVLRSLFDNAAGEKDGTFSKTTLRELKKMSLLTPRRKGPFGWLFGD